LANGFQVGMIWGERPRQDRVALDHLSHDSQMRFALKRRSLGEKQGARL
jgi:hypothetical protein